MFITNLLKWLQKDHSSVFMNQADARSSFLALSNSCAIFSAVVLSPTDCMFVMMVTTTPVEECVRSRWVTPAGRYWPPQHPLCARRNVCGCGTARISAVSLPPASPGRTVRLCPTMPPFCPPVPIWLWPCGVWGSQEARLCSSVRPSDSCREERYRTAGGHPQWTEIHLQPICTNCPHRGSWQHDPFYWGGRTCRQDVKLVNDK